MSNGDKFEISLKGTTGVLCSRKVLKNSFLDRFLNKYTHWTRSFLEKNKMFLEGSYGNVHKC